MLVIRIGGCHERSSRFDRLTPDVSDVCSCVGDFPPQVANASLPVCPVEPGFDMHWLAVDGQQPLLPQNPLPGSAKGAASESLIFIFAALLLFFRY